MRISEKEKAQLGYSRPPPSPYSDHNSSPKTSNRSSDIDFSDVFGGPPKRASLQDTQSRYSGESSRGGADSNDDTSPRRSSWGEKPVFGSETRRYPSGGFFDDIFRGDESLSSSPRMDSKDPSSSAAASRIVSPTRPLPAGVELLGFPAESSFPRMLESSNSLSNSMRRNSGKAVQNQGVIQGGDAVSSYRWGPLSHGVSRDEKLRNNVMADGSCSGSQVSIGGGMFHFSMHKWASKGMPLVMSLCKGNSLRSKDKDELERSVSLNGSAELENDALVGKIVDETATDAFKLTPSYKVEDTEPSFPMGSGSNAEKVSKFDTVAHKSDLEKSSAELHGVENAASEVKGNQKMPEVKLTPVLDIDDAESDEGLERSKLKESSGFKGTIMRNSVDGQGNIGNDMYGGKVEEATGDDRASSGKVKNFANIFNHEPSSKLTTDVNCKSSRWGNTGVSRKNSKPALIPTKKEEKIQSFDLNCGLDSSPQVEEIHISDGKQSHCNNAHEPDEGLSRMDENLGSTPGLVSEDFEAWSTSFDDTYGNFLIEELPEVADKSTDGNENHEDIKILESKILKWSKGKEGNIRALLSTLQYVLWPNSGWKPVPLVDIIEANAVKRSYQRALLRLHPDKLQQKGAAFHHKFIAEKVFDILQEAWDHFNTLGSL